jgi:hypothetical protein
MKTNYLLFKKKLYKTLKLFFFFNLLLSTTLSFTQQKSTLKIIKDFQDYVSDYREVAYSNLNKSTYIKGETLGFCSYVLDKAKKAPSLLTKNLYCVITDENNQIVKSKLIKVNKGIAYNSFEIDSLFTNGKYTFKAYTNWMKNFDEPNAFIESFKVIDPEKNSYQKKENLSTIVDAQFLPEGGHFVNNVKTKVGVTIKDNNGYGIPNSIGEVYDSNNTLITSFKTNFLGIGNFSLLPTKQNYLIKINHLKKEQKYTITGIKNKGVSIQLNQSNNKIAIKLSTNKETLKDIKNKPFKLTIHNGDIIKEGVIKFKETSFIKIIDYKNLLPGINIFTLFDEDNTPILERLFFNYKGIETLTLEEASFSKKGDSLQINIPFSQPSYYTKKDIHLSVSVLPNETKSYQKNHNIISYTYLQPYVKGHIENAGYYFTNINRKKKYHLDNLLLTQGWSSYNWNSIFENNTTNRFAFEDGITIKVNKNNINNHDFFISPLKLSNPSFIKVKENKKFFVENGLYPLGKESLKLSTLNKKGKLIKPNLYVQFSPQKVPGFNHYLTFSLPPKSLFYSFESKVKPFTKLELNQQQELDEVIIKANLREKRFDKIKKQHMMEHVYFIDNKKNSHLTLAQYINYYIPTYFVRENLGKFNITNRRATGLNGPRTPLLYLDDIPLTNNDIFYNYSMNKIDYIVSNPNGYGYGLRGGKGIVKIYTKTAVDHIESIDNFRKFKFPLSFSKNKKFYIPKYHTYNNSFYKEYGVIDWIPNCKLDSNGNLSFKIHNPANVDISLFIEGISQDGKYISTKKVLTVNSNN